MIVNGEETTEITNQMMGGRMNDGNMPGGKNADGAPNENRDNKGVDGGYGRHR